MWLLKRQHHAPSVLGLLRRYWCTSSFVDRRMALSAGVVCVIGNVLQFQGGQLVGYATADLVQAYPLVSTFWDVLWFGEFRTLFWPSRMALLLFGMYLAYGTGVVLFAGSSVGAGSYNEKIVVSTTPCVETCNRHIGFRILSTTDSSTCSACTWSTCENCRVSQKFTAMACRGITHDTSLKLKIRGELHGSILLNVSEDSHSRDSSLTGSLSTCKCPCPRCSCKCPFVARAAIFHGAMKNFGFPCL